MNRDAQLGTGAIVSTKAKLPATTVGRRSPGYDVAAWRARIPLLQTHTALNSCSQGAQMVGTRAAAEAYLDSWNRDGMDWEEWTEQTYRAKVEFARLINASPDEIAVSTSVSEASASLISAFDPAGSRRKVVSTEAEFPSISQVWMAFQKYGLRVDWVPVRDQIVHLEDYDRYLDDQTLLVSATHAYYQNGFKQDLAPIAQKAHAAGALLFVDAYQTLGTHPIDVKALGIDFLATGNLKYLMGVPGIAFLYARGDLLDRLHPAITGWFGRSNPYSFQPKVLDWPPTAARLDTGTPPVINAYIARAGMAGHQRDRLREHPRLDGRVVAIPHRRGPSTGLHPARPRRRPTQEPVDGIRLPGRRTQGRGAAQGTAHPRLGPGAGDPTRAPLLLDLRRLHDRVGRSGRDLRRGAG